MRLRSGAGSTRALVELQEANLSVEQDGPDAVDLPPELFENLADVEILISQFTPIPERMIDGGPVVESHRCASRGRGKHRRRFCDEAGGVGVQHAGTQCESSRRMHVGADSDRDSQLGPIARAA